MSKKHDYKHLDNGWELEVKFTMEQLAKMVDDLNYGTHRFLSELVDYRRKKYDDNGWLPDRLGNEIEKLLNEGLS